MVIRSCCATMLFAIALLGGCSSKEGSAGLPLEVSVAQPASPARSIPFSSSPASLPSARLCPSQMPQLCDAGCCPADAACEPDGGCSLATVTPACPAEAPVSCSSAIGCGPLGCVARDLSANHNDFTLPPPTGFVAGRFGTAVSTNQSGCPSDAGVIHAASRGLPIGNNAESIELWMNFPSTSLNLLEGLFAEGDRHLDLDLNFPYPAQLEGNFAVANPSAGSWHFVVYTWAPGTDGGGQAALYVDAVASLGTPVLASYFTNADAGLVLGMDPATNCNAFVGAIDELRIEDVAIDGGQIAADYAAGPLALDQHTVGLWHFDEGASARCCPAGDSCDPSFGCVAPIADVSSCPVPCANGQACCASGQICVGNSCADPASTPTCPQSAPVDCGDGSCCPAGELCESGHCVHDLPSAASTACAQGDVAVAVDAGVVACCPAPSAGSLFTVVEINATGCGLNSLRPLCAYAWGGDCSNGAACPSCLSVSCGGGFNCCGDGACAELATAPMFESCGDGVACSGADGGAGGCCAAGGSCTRSGACCSAGEFACGPGCCPNGSSCDAHGNCIAAPVAAGCSATCPEGTTCSRGNCIAGPQQPASCSTGLVCGQHCCTENEECVQSECVAATLAVRCADGELETECGCCPADSVCIDGRCAEASDPFTGPGGPACGREQADHCESGDACGAGGVCCPAEESEACGDNCCGPLESCDGGVCTCPADFPLSCHGDCCQEGELCTSAGCAIDCYGKGIPPCNGNCCDEGSTCVDGSCSCPDSDHPVACGGICCVAGATCSSATECSCPVDHETCGADCCSPGDVCKDGICTAPAGSAGNAFDGFYEGTQDGTNVCNGSSTSLGQNQLVFSVLSGVLLSPYVGAVLSDGSISFSWSGSFSSGHFAFVGTLVESNGSVAGSGTWTGTDALGSNPQCSSSGHWSASRQ